MKKMFNCRYDFHHGFFMLEMLCYNFPTFKQKFIYFPRFFALTHAGIQQGGAMEKPSDPKGGENIAIMTVHDVANYLRLSEAKVYRLAKEGNVPSFRLGKSWRFRRDLLDEWTIKETQHIPENAG